MVLARSRYSLSHFFFGLLWLKFWPSLFSSVVFGSLSKSLFSFFALYMDWPSGRITECEVYVVACCQSQRADNSFPPGNHTESSITQYAFAHVEDGTRYVPKKNGQFLHSWLMCSTSICVTTMLIDNCLQLFECHCHGNHNIRCLCLAVKTLYEGSWQ